MSNFGTVASMNPRPFQNRPPDQVAYVVPDLRAAVERYGRLLGVQQWFVWDYDTDYLPNRRYRGQPSDYRSIVAMPAYGSMVELVQPIAGPSIYTTLLEERGPGLHHIGYYVDSVADARRSLVGSGAEEIMSGGGHGVDGDGEFAFFDLVPDFGSFLEVVEPPKRRYEAHFTIELD